MNRGHCLPNVQNSVEVESKLILLIFPMLFTGTWKDHCWHTILSVDAKVSFASPLPYAQNIFETKEGIWNEKYVWVQR